MQVIHPDRVLIYLAVFFQNLLWSSVEIVEQNEKSVYFLWEILFRHDPKAAVPLQSIHRMD